jgi:hypothetical protein
MSEFRRQLNDWPLVGSIPTRRFSRIPLPFRERQSQRPHYGPRSRCAGAAAPSSCRLEFSNLVSSSLREEGPNPWLFQPTWTNAYRRKLTPRSPRPQSDRQPTGSTGQRFTHDSASCFGRKSLNSPAALCLRLPGFNRFLMAWANVPSRLASLRQTPVQPASAAALQTGSCSGPIL